MKTAVLAIGCLLAAAALRAQEPPPPRQYALVIGLDTSESNIEGVSRLAFAEKDASDVEEALKARGFEVVLLKGDLARRENIVKALARLAREAHPLDTVIIYFSGHGVRAKWAPEAKRHHTYWVTYDTTLARIEVDGLRLEHVMDYVDDIPAAKKLVILDHCHSGTVELPRSGGDAGAGGAGGGGGGGGSRDGTGTLAVKRDLFLKDEFREGVERRVQEGLLILASAADASAFEMRTLGHGLFTFALLQALKTNAADAFPAGNGDGKLSADELAKYLKASVSKLARDNNVQQEAFDVPRGAVLGWDIMALPQDPDKDARSLLQVIGRLAASLTDQREVDEFAPVEAALSLGVRSWAEARRNQVSPNDRDQRIVRRLQAIQALGAAADWKSEAGKLAGFLQGLN